MFEIENLEEFCAEALKEIEFIQAYWSSLYRQYARNIFREIVKESPQWSGNFAANWNFKIDSPDYTYVPYDQEQAATFDGGIYRAKGHTRFRGNMTTVLEAMRRNEAAFEMPILGYDIYITNATPYGDIIAENHDPDDAAWSLRPRNFLDPMPYPLGHVMTVADNIFRSIS